MSFEKKSESKIGHLEDYPDVLTSEQLRRFLNIGKDKTYELLKYGEIKSVKIGKIYRIPKQFLQKFLLGND